MVCYEDAFSARTVNKKTKKQKGAGIEQSCTGFPLLRTCLLFFSVILAFNLVEWLLLKPWQVELFQIATAKVVSSVMSMSGLQNHLQGTHIFFPGAHWEVVSECTALQAMYVFVAFVIAYPSLLMSKGVGIGLGLPLLFVANIVRLLVLAWAIQLVPDYAEIVHDYVWQVAFLFLLVLMWMGWMDLVVKREKIPSIPT